jgi:hypothetical protein
MDKSSEAVDHASEDDATCKVDAGAPVGNYTGR